MMQKLHSQLRVCYFDFISIEASTDDIRTFDKKQAKRKNAKNDNNKKKQTTKSKK